MYVVKWYTMLMYVKWYTMLMYVVKWYTMLMYVVKWYTMLMYVNTYRIISNPNTRFVRTTSLKNQEGLEVKILVVLWQSHLIYDREYHRGNQKWTIQRNWQQDEDKRQSKSQDFGCVMTTCITFKAGF